jgi:hypothetical protein
MHRLISQVMIKYYYALLVMLTVHRWQAENTDRHLVRRVLQGMRMWHGFCFSTVLDVISTLLTATETHPCIDTFAVTVSLSCDSCLSVVPIPRCLTAVA